MPETQATTTKQESFRRWQDRAIAQRQATSALLLAFSGAALGFTMSLLDKEKTYLGFVQSLAFQLHFVTQLISMGAGVAFSLNRVRDFDLTSQIARTREIEPTAPRLSTMRKKVRFWGRITRRLYFAQAFAFVVSSVLLALFVIARYEHVLFL